MRESTAQNPRFKKLKFICALLTALLLWLPVQKWGLFPLAWVGLTPIFWVARDMDAKERLRYGWRAGFLFYVLTNWWILPTIIYGSPMIGAPPALGAFLGVLAVSFIAAVHGWQFAIALWLWDIKKWARHLWLLPIMVALFWGFFDYVRCIPPLAHIWGALAFTQWRDLPLLQIAPYIGQHGITILLVWFGAMATLYFQQRRAFYWAVPLVIFGGLHLAGVWRLNTPVIGRTLGTVCLVSTNVPSLRKTNKGTGETPAEQALHLSKVAPPFSLVVWPETTIEVFGVKGSQTTVAGRGEAARVMKTLNEGQRRTLLTGAALHVYSGLEEELYNTALLLSWSEPAFRGSAPKIRTVPMGERAPFGEYVPFLRRFAPNPQVTPGTQPQPLQLGSYSLGTVICFESCFPDPARTLKKQGAQVLFVITNDEYFRGTNAPWEHATMAVMRAAENQLPVAQVANGGYTLLIDSQGRILHQSFGMGATVVNIALS